MSNSDSSAVDAAVGYSSLSGDDGRRSELLSAAEALYTLGFPSDQAYVELDGFTKGLPADVGDARVELVESD